MEELGRLEERVILIGVQTAAEDNVLDSWTSWRSLQKLQEQ